MNLLNNHLHFLFLLLISITQFPLASQGCHEEERRVLLNIKSSLKDPADRLSSWQEGSKNCCIWHGIGCSNDSLHVNKIDLRNKDTENYDTALRGNLYPLLFKITHLEYLDLSWNSFQYSETPQIANLTKLIHLDLSNSNMWWYSDLIELEFTNLSSLQYLDLSCSSVYCSDLLSMEWVRLLVNLKVLRLMNVQLSEATSSGKNFGEHISCLSNLRELDLSGCGIGNPIFHIQKFHNLSHLYSLKMNDNSDWRAMTYDAFPLHLDNLNSLSILELSNCVLQGSVPYLPQLIELDVSGNVNLHVDLTKMFEHQWPKLQKLSINHTRVEGPIPISISNAPLLSRLSASYCSIQGSFPSSIYNLSHLQFLSLSQNNIAGVIHSSISSLRNLHFLDLSYNSFQGSIPESICEILPLQQLSLNYNYISGSIPSCITKLRHLSIFDVSRNAIEGDVPLISLINELNLTDLRLSINRLTVVIDQDLRLSQFQLQSLELQSCNMKGSIPTFICNLTHLKYLDLTNNDLTGDIPSCMYKLDNFNRFGLWNDGLLRRPQLSGPLPPQYSNAKENVLFYGNAALGFIVGFWGLFFGLLMKKEKWWCGYWRFIDTVAARIVRVCRQITHLPSQTEHHTNTEWLNGSDES